MILGALTVRVDRFRLAALLDSLRRFPNLRFLQDTMLTACIIDYVYCISSVYSFEANLCINVVGRIVFVFAKQAITTQPAPKNSAQMHGEKMCVISHFQGISPTFESQTMMTSF